MSKKILYVIVVVAILIASGIAIFADTGYFEFYLSPGHHESSSSVTKTSSLNAAVVSITDGNIRSGDLVLFRARRSSDGAAATEAKYYDQTGVFALNYNTYMGFTGEKYYLNGYEDPNTPWPGGIFVFGEWNP